MLVLSRKVGERISIGDNVTITVVRISPTSVRIGVDAPNGVSIVRQELLLEAELIDDDGEETAPQRTLVA